MLITFEGAVMKLDGTPAQQPNGIDGGVKDLMIKDAVIEALLATTPEDRPGGSAGPQADKMVRFTIAQKIHNANGPAVDLSVEELSTIKKAVLSAWSPLVVGRVYERIEAAR